MYGLDLENGPEIKKIYLIFERQFYSQLKMQERRRSEWLKEEKDITKCKACLGPSLTNTGLLHRTLV